MEPKNPQSPQDPHYQAEYLSLEGAKELGPFRSFFARMSLQNKLALITMLILFSGLLLAAVLTVTIVRSSLIAQVDDDLYSTYSSIAQQLLNDQESQSSLLPSDYFMAYRDSTTDEWQYWHTTQTLQEHGLPNLEAYIPVDPAGYAGERFKVPFTTTSFEGATLWRVAVQPIFYAQQAEPVGYVYVALPLTETRVVIGHIQQALIISAVAIAIIGGVLGMVAVARSLRPLTRIEQTAARIAKGDLSLRVPQSPLGTEIGSVAQSLNLMLGQLEIAFADRERSEQKMRQFVSDASHELRTPLATIRGYGELYRMGAIPNKTAMDDTMRRVEDSATRMASLVDDLLHLARLDEGRPLRMEPVDLGILAVDSTSDLRALDPTREIKLVRSTSANSVTEVIGDEDKLRQVFANLVGNIARHTPEGTPVEIALSSSYEGDREMVHVEFCDHGPGVESEHLDKVFERFYRVDSSRNRKSGGSGLGLAIVSAIMYAHNGSIEVFETLGGGLTVRISIPASEQANVIQQ